jgi:3-dehydroquinate dehydratase-2
MRMPPLIFILSGPNLNMLGKREPEIYGTTTLKQIERQCGDRAFELEVMIDFRQSNHEGELVEWIQEAYTRGAKGMIINGGAYTHTSLAIHDALKMLPCPIIELHLSDPKKREEFRHHSYIELVATAVIAGHGAPGYTMALEKMAELIKAGN